MEAKKYRAVDSNGREFEVPLMKTAGTVPATAYARAPDANGKSSKPSRPAAIQARTR